MSRTDSRAIYARKVTPTPQRFAVLKEVRTACSELLPAADIVRPFELLSKQSARTFHGADSLQAATRLLSVGQQLPGRSLANAGNYSLPSGREVWLRGLCVEPTYLGLLEGTRETASLMILRSSAKWAQSTFHGSPVVVAPPAADSPPTVPVRGRIRVAPPGAGNGFRLRFPSRGGVVRGKPCGEHRRTDYRCPRRCGLGAERGRRIHGWAVTTQPPLKTLGWELAPRSG